MKFIAIPNLKYKVQYKIITEEKIWLDWDRIGKFSSVKDFEERFCCNEDLAEFVQKIDESLYEYNLTYKFHLRLCSIEEEINWDLKLLEGKI